ncbi:MAG TPA: DUF1538 family protein [Spirochaetia bacterium]|nr:DUF1538 family protein [Spirochaetia bacterium]
MPTSTAVRIPFRRKLAMIGAWGRSRLGAQARAVAFVVVYLVLSQTLLLDQPIRDPLSVVVGIAATIAGLAFFLEGLFLGVMPLGERCGIRLPGRVGPVVIAVFALVLGVTATLAEPAIGILKLQGGSARPWSTPLLYLLLNRGSGWLVAAVAAGVGLAVALGVFRFLHRWPLKPFIYALIPPLVAVTFLFGADPNLKAVAGLAWDTGGVTTGPVTVPLVIALGIGVSRIVGSRSDASGGLGVVTLASALPVAAVFALAVALLPSVPAPGGPAAFFSEAERERAVFVAGSEEALAELAAGAVASGSLAASDFVALFPDYDPLAVAFGGGGDEGTELRGRLGDSALSALKAVLPLAFVLIVTLVFLLKDRLVGVDELVLGLVFAVLGLFLFNFGMEKGLTALGAQAGASLPRAYERTERPDRALLLRGVTEADVVKAVGPDGPAEYIWMDGADGPVAVPFDRALWDEASGAYRYVPVERAVFDRWGRNAGFAAALLFVFILGFGATLAEPSLSALGTTVEDLTTGTYKKSTLVGMVAVGVGLGLAFGFASILFDLPLAWVLGVPYALALVLTAFAPEDFAAIAWDSAGVTTGPITVPLVIATGLGIGGRAGAASSFGVVAAASVFPVVAVLGSGLWRTARARSALAAMSQEGRS